MSNRKDQITLREVIASWDVDSMLNERSIKYLVMEKVDLASIMDQTLNAIKQVQTSFKSTKDLIDSLKSNIVKKEGTNINVSLIDQWLNEAESSLNSHIENYALQMQDEKKLKALAISSQKLIDQYNDFNQSLKATKQYLDQIIQTIGKADGDQSINSILNPTQNNDEELKKVQQLENNIEKVFQKFIKPEGKLSKFGKFIGDLFKEKPIKEFPLISKDILEELIALMINTKLDTISNATVPESPPEVTIDNKTIAQSQNTEKSGKAGDKDKKPDETKANSTNAKKNVAADAEAGKTDATGAEAGKPDATAETPAASSDYIGKIIDDWNNEIKNIENTFGSEGPRQQFVDVIKNNTSGLKDSLQNNLDTIKNEIKKSIEEYFKLKTGIRYITLSKKLNFSDEMNKLYSKITDAILQLKFESNNNLTRSKLNRMVHALLDHHFKNSSLIKETKSLNVNKKSTSNSVDFNRINKLAGLED
jgi:hypothetical protein